MRVSLTPAAYADLASILDWLGRRSPAGRDKVGAAIRHTVRLIGGTPFIGRPGEFPGSREFPVRGYPYLIIYRVYEDRDAVFVVSIVHMARSAPYRDDP